MKTRLTATDPEVAQRTWRVPMDEMTKTKTGPTRHRHEGPLFPHLSQVRAGDARRNLPRATAKAGLLGLLWCSNFTHRLFQIGLNIHQNILVVADGVQHASRFHTSSKPIMK